MSTDSEDEVGHGQEKPYTPQERPSTPEHWQELLQQQLSSRSLETGKLKDALFSFIQNLDNVSGSPKQNMWLRDSVLFSQCFFLCSKPIPEWKKPFWQI